MYDLLSAFITAFVISYYAIPSVIKIAWEKNLCDEPGERRSHQRSIPTLGGIAMFAGLIFALTLWVPFGTYPKVQYIIAAYLIIFLIGAKDDIIPLTPYKKLLGQVVAAGLLVFKAGIGLTSLYGLFGCYDLPELLAQGLSVFTILVIINALNLIDGINGLAGSIGCILSLSFGYWAFQHGRLDLAILAASLMGALVAFLRYNFYGARIFMGDTGSLILGLSAAILALEFIEINKQVLGSYHLPSAPALAIAVLIVPLFDTLRVFILRALRGRSPFSPDRTHIHHVLLDLGLSHVGATLCLGLVNLGFIVLAWYLRDLGTWRLALLLLFVASLLSSLAFGLLLRKRRLAGA